jgi:hypothetical protein
MSLIPPATLILRETLLGALKGRLENPSNLTLHASDFHVAVSQIGLEFGSQDVDDIMVMCKIDEVSSGVPVWSFAIALLTLSARSLATSTSPCSPSTFWTLA